MNYEAIRHHLEAGPFNTLAVVDGNVVLGDDVRIWQFASIIRGANIGPGCNIGSCAMVDGARLGARVSVGHGAFIGPGTLIGDDVFIGPGAIICNDAWPSRDKTGFDLEALIDHRIITVWIDEQASIGAGAIILPGVMIGSAAMVAAGAVVDKPVASGHLFKRDGTIVAIDPGRPIKRMRSAV